MKGLHAAGHQPSEGFSGNQSDAELFISLTRQPSEGFSVFQLSAREFAGLRSQNATASKRNIHYMPYTFTEHGAIMAANVLNSKRAVHMSVFVVRAFIRMRSLLTGNEELARRLSELERVLKKRLDVHETAIVGILQRIMALIDSPSLPPPKKRPIGFGREDQ